MDTINRQITTYSKELRVPVFRRDYKELATEAARQGLDYEAYLVKLMEREYELIITTNLGFDRWVEIFGDPILTAALVDRVTHKAYLVNMSGDSYRLKETEKMMNGK